VQRNNQMTYVWAVKPDSTVTVQQVELGVSEGTQTEVTSGIDAGALVVMTGVDKLQEGIKVNAQLEGQGGRPPQQPGAGAGTARGPAAGRPKGKKAQ